MPHTTIEEKLSALAKCGLTLRDGVGIDALEESWGRRALDGPGFDLSLVCLGMTEERPPWRPNCVNLWHFDTECIEGPGSYARIAARMSEMAQGSLPLANIEDHVDIEAKQAWLKFTCKGVERRIECAVEDDWVDAGVFSHFNALLGRCDSSKVFIYYDLRGQDCILGCLTIPQFASLKRLIPKVESLT